MSLKDIQKMGNWFFHCLLGRCSLGVREIALSLVALSLFFSGCSEIETPTAREVLTHPFGTHPPFPRGTSKKEVLASWGEPDEVFVHGVDELGNAKEEWIYTARLPGVPIDYRYVTKTKRLFFDGENLVRWETVEPEGPASTQNP